jgi:hypothetical protein
MEGLRSSKSATFLLRIQRQAKNWFESRLEV